MKRTLRFKIDMKECPVCGGAHAHWWFTSKVPPPSCAEDRRGTHDRS